MKDRYAVTRQWFSLHMPGQPSSEPSALESEGLRVLRPGGRLVVLETPIYRTRAAGDAMAIVWDLAERPPRAVYNLFGILGEVSHVKISPDEKFFAAAGADMNVFVWDLATGEQVMGKKFATADQDRKSVV